jgi:hypothetical protein
MFQPNATITSFNILLLVHWSVSIFGLASISRPPNSARFWPRVATVIRQVRYVSHSAATPRIRQHVGAHGALSAEATSTRGCWLSTLRIVCANQQTRYVDWYPADYTRPLLLLWHSEHGEWSRRPRTGLTRYGDR